MIQNLERDDGLIEYKQITHTGNRDHNEDSAICLESSGNFCFVVADGLGGHGRGEVASQKLIEVFKREFENGYEDSEKYIENTFLKAQEEILELQEQQGDRFGMKTTAVALSIRDGKCRWGHIGDSRLYVFQKDRVKIRTLDHSVPQMLVLSGEIKEKHISTHPDRNRLLRVMGIEWDSSRYEISEDELSLGDCQAFLLCTDGFWENITSRMMCKLLKKSTSVEEWVELMIKEVERKGQGSDLDNYTAIGVLVR